MAQRAIRPIRRAAGLLAGLLLAAAGCTWQDFDPPWPRWPMREWPPEAPPGRPEPAPAPEPQPAPPTTTGAVEV